MGKSDAKLSSNRRMADINSERLLYVLACLVGREVEVQLKNNSYIRGLFHSCEAGLKNGEKREMEITLYHARELPAVDKLSGEIQRMLIIPGSQFVAICAESCPLEFVDPEEETKELKTTNSHSFQTDVEICNAKGNLGQGRELQKWMSEEGGDEIPLELNVMLEDPDAARGWDQFELNKRRFGVQTTYEDEIYTTRLDVKSIPRFVQERADRIAREIENQPTFGFADPERIAEGDLNEDEEALFSAVRGTGGFKDRHNSRNIRTENQRNNVSDKKPVAGSVAASVVNTKVSLKGSENFGSFSSGSGGGGIAMKVSSSSLKELRENLECAARENNAKKNIINSSEAESQNSKVASSMPQVQVTNGVNAVNHNNINDLHSLSLSANNSSSNNLNYNNKPHSTPIMNAEHNSFDGEGNNNLLSSSFSSSISSSSSCSYDSHQQPKKMRGMLNANSPTSSPVCSVELKGINALNLEPALPKLDEHTRNEWISFKQTQNRQSRGSSFASDRRNEKREFENALKVINERLNKGKLSQNSSVRERDGGNFTNAPTTGSHRNNNSSTACNNSMSSLLSGALKVGTASDSSSPAVRQYSSNKVQSQAAGSFSGAEANAGAAHNSSNAMNAQATSQIVSQDNPHVILHGDSVMSVSGGNMALHAVGSVSSNNNNNTLSYVSSMNKKSFQFNPNANAFTPSTPSSAACGAPRVATIDSVGGVGGTEAANFSSVHNANTNINAVSNINANSLHANVGGPAATEMPLQAGAGASTGAVAGPPNNNIHVQQQTSEISQNATAVMPVVACVSAVPIGGSGAGAAAIGATLINPSHIVAAQNAMTSLPQASHTDSHSNSIIAVAGSAVSHLSKSTTSPFCINPQPMQFNINNLIPNLIPQSIRLPQQVNQAATNFVSLANNKKAIRLSINEYLNQIMSNIRRENLELSAYEWNVLSDLSYKNILGDIPATNQALLSAVVQHGNASNPPAHLGGGASHAFFHHAGIPQALIATGALAGGGGDANGPCPTPLGALPYPNAAMMYGNAFPFSQASNTINALAAAAQLGVGTVVGGSCGNVGRIEGGAPNQMPPNGIPPPVRPGPNPHVQAAAAAAANALTHLPTANAINTQNTANIPTVVGLQTPMTNPIQHSFHPIISQGFQLQNHKYANSLHGVPAHMINPYAPYAFTIPQTPQQFGGNISNHLQLGENRVVSSGVQNHLSNTAQQQTAQNNANQQNAYPGALPHNANPSNLPPPHPHAVQMSSITHNQHQISSRQTPGGISMNNNNATYNVAVSFPSGANGGHMHATMK